MSTCYLSTLGLMFLCIIFSYMILRDTNDMLVVTDKGSNVEIVPFLKTWVNFPMANVDSSTSSHPHISGWGACSSVWVRSISMFKFKCCLLLLFLKFLECHLKNLYFCILYLTFLIFVTRWLSWFLRLVEKNSIKELKELVEQNIHRYSECPSE